MIYRIYRTLFISINLSPANLSFFYRTIKPAKRRGGCMFLVLQYRTFCEMVSRQEQTDDDIIIACFSANSFWKRLVSSSFI